jgi:hypothetical protein
MNIPIAGLFEDEGEKNSDNKYHNYYVPLQFNDVVTRENVELIVDRGNQILEITVDPQYHERVAAKMDIISFKTNGGVLLPRAFHPINFQKHGASINKKYQTWIQQAFPHTQGVAAKQSQSVRPQMQGAPAPSARAPQSQQDVQGQMTGVLNERRLWREEQLRKRNQRIEAEKLAASKPRAEDSQVLDIPEIADIMAIEAEI